MSTRQSSVEVVAIATVDHSASAGKKSSNQAGGPGAGRTKGPRVSSRGYQGHTPPSEEAPAGPRKKVPSSHKDTKSRPPRSHGGHREGSKSGGGTSQYSSRGRVTVDSHHGSSRHRTGGSGSADSGGNSTGTRPEARILSSNRFEKLEIDPEQDALSTSRENLSKSSSTTSISPSDSGSLMTASSSFSSRGSEDKRPAKERSSRNGGRGSFRGKGSAKLEFAENSHHSGSLKDNKRDDVGQKKKLKQIKFNLSSKAESECSALPGDDSAFFLESLEHASSDEVNSAVDGSKVRSVGQMEADVERIVYSRDILLAIRELSFSLPPPDLDIPPRVGYVTPTPYTTPYATPFSADNAFQKDSTESSDEGRPKHPTALTLVKEHDKNSVSKVSLSPQRRSFQRGCSWKDKVSGSDVSQNSSDASLKTPPAKISCSDTQNDKFQGGRAGASHGPRVINHIPLRDQAQADRQGKKGWKGSAEPEPEWMEFGPTDRFDVIELKGFDEHEVERGDPEEEVSTQDIFTDDMPDHTHKDNSLPRNDGGEELSHQKQTTAAHHQHDENEFILDGFDFSTSVSICQALDLDEDEGNSTPTDVLVVPKKGVKGPAELGNVLLKALGVNKDTAPTETKEGLQQYATNTGITSNHRASTDTPPANALTLDEIHAREDIHPTSTQPPQDRTSTGEGMEAFNKLLAVLESKQSSREEYTPAQNYPVPADAGHLKSSPHQRMRAARPDNPVKQVSPGFGYPLDKELLNIEEDLSVANMDFPEPNIRRLEQLERMLETMDRMDPTATPLPGYHHVPTAVPARPSHTPPSHPPPHRLLHQMDQRVPVHQMDRGGWMFPQERGVHPTPQQLAAARQHQMLTSSRTANNWAVEMEQRRLMELRQMQLAQEKEMYGGGVPPGGGGVPHGGMMPQGYSKSPKPNISLLPTAVMRHLHNKPSPQTPDLTKTSSISSRLDQDLTSKASQTHSVLNSLLNQNQEFSAPGGDYDMHSQHRVPAGMRVAPPPAHNPPNVGDFTSAGSLYPRYNVPHGMPVHNPYMY